MTLVYRFLMEDELPTNELMAKQIIRKSCRYAPINDSLYRRSSTQPWLQCVIEDDGRSILRDIYEGDCGSHEVARKIS